MANRMGLAVVLASIVALSGCGKKVPSLPLSETEKIQVAQIYKDGSKQTFRSNGRNVSRVYYQDFCVGGSTVDILGISDNLLEVGNISASEVIYFKRGRFYAVHALVADGSCIGERRISYKEFSEQELRDLGGFRSNVLESIVRYQKSSRDDSK